MAKKIKLKVVIGTKRALAESFLKLLPAFRHADEHFDAPMLQASRKPFQTRATQRVGEVFVCLAVRNELSHDVVVLQGFEFCGNEHTWCR